MSQPAAGPRADDAAEPSSAAAADPRAAAGGASQEDPWFQGGDPWAQKLAILRRRLRMQRSGSSSWSGSVKVHKDSRSLGTQTPFQWEREKVSLVKFLVFWPQLISLAVPPLEASCTVLWAGCSK